MDFPFSWRKQENEKIEKNYIFPWTKVFTNTGFGISKLQASAKDTEINEALTTEKFAILDIMKH